MSDILDRAFPGDSDHQAGNEWLAGALRQMRRDPDWATHLGRIEHHDWRRVVRDIVGMVRAH